MSDKWKKRLKIGACWLGVTGYFCLIAYMIGAGKSYVQSATDLLNWKFKMWLMTYTPVEGAPNSLLDIDDLDLIMENIDDPAFRLEYGVSDAAYDDYMQLILEEI